MSVNTSRSTVQVSDHALQRFIQRTGRGDFFATELAFRFHQGIRVDIKGKRYSEARLIQVAGTTLVLLRCDTHLATVVYARGEEITFRSKRPNLECRRCGVVRRDAPDTRPCACCDTNDWRVVE
ncbi:hypothetical protein [Salinigranum marinum]|uniref:hypothetical protein n=1 Tax=Salinigranum marinum TaxID=1515595 RepID=UPI002989A162|nr:hypothetical protein [Salinigranum marinum]